ncbi:MAG: class C sortase [Oscillospiraceae bacterium]
MKKKPLVAICLVFILGLTVLLYPVVSAFISKKTSTAAVERYRAAVEHIDTDRRDAMLAASWAYNKGLAEGSNHEAYETLLNVNGIMAYLEIPKLKIYLPVYHGVSEETLQQGVGHLPETSLPVGGAGTHAVLSAHCGLPNARLFTDLDQLEMGDRFLIHVLGQTLCYEVDRVEVVLPYEVGALAIASGRDDVTLLTCTPYGINSHRLLVRGARVPDAPKHSAEGGGPTLREE